jgi:predicted RNA-binding Zn-ribbon protein involved in translation (DUF1610 family)
MVELKCPKCGEKIGAMGIRQIRYIVVKLVKNIDKLGEIDKKALIADIEKLDREERDVFECDKCKAEVPNEANFCPNCGERFEGFQT